MQNLAETSMLDKVAHQITSFFSSIILVIKQKIAETTNVIYFFLGVQQRDFDGDNITKWGHRTFK